MSDGNLQPPSFTRPMEEQASEWAARLDGGALSWNDRRSLRAWLEADPRHPACLAHYRRLMGSLKKDMSAMGAAGVIAAPETRAPGSARGLPRWVFPLAGGIAAAGLVLLLRGSGGIRVEAGAGEHRTVALPDGSTADLDARTVLVADMGSSIRKVRLIGGEALFSVRHDAHRPFVVEIPGGSVRDVGTVFDVRCDASGAFDVTVLEGAVRVVRGDGSGAAAGRPLTLRAGQRLASADAGDEVTSLSRTEAADRVAWRQGAVVFDGTSVADALASFARFNGRTIIVGPGAGVFRLGGRYGLEDLDGFLDRLEKMFPLTEVRRADGSILVDARNPAGP